MISIKECRFCLMSDESLTNPFLSPCKCTGSVKYVHQICLTKWRKTDLRMGQDTNCPMCLSIYDKTIVFIFEDMPDYSQNRFVMFLLNPRMVVFFVNSLFCLYFIAIRQIPIKIYEKCLAGNNTICPEVYIYYTPINIEKEFIVFHDWLFFAYFLTFVGYFLKVFNKRRYLIMSLRVAWVPIIHYYIITNITRYYFLFGLLHHLILPSYFSIHLQTLRIMNNDF